MDAVTYPNPKVQEFIRRNLIPVKWRYDQEPLASEFKIRWTPTLVLVDDDGIERHRTMGYLPPEDFMASFKLGIGRLHFEREAYDKAIGEMEQLLEEFPGNDTCAEAVYWLGVSKYKDTGDPAFLKKAYETLKSEYPKSEWTRKAQPYSLI